MGNKYYTLNKKTVHVEGYQGEIPVINSAFVEPILKSEKGVKYVKGNKILKAVQNKFGATKSITKKSTTTVVARKRQTEERAPAAASKPNSYQVYQEILHTKVGDKRKNKVSIPQQLRSSMWSELKQGFENGTIKETKKDIRKYLEDHYDFTAVKE